jgi:hypothetical protein
MRARGAEDFVFTGTFAQAVTPIGMSVPPLMTKAIADSIVDAVLQPYGASIAGAIAPNVAVHE